MCLEHARPHFNDTNKNLIIKYQILLTQIWESDHGNNSGNNEDDGQPMQFIELGLPPVTVLATLVHLLFGDLELNYNKNKGCK